MLKMRLTSHIKPSQIFHKMMINMPLSSHKCHVFLCKKICIIDDLFLLMTSSCLFVDDILYIDIKNMAKNKIIICLMYIIS
jgi:hypothetical protein